MGSNPHIYLSTDVYTDNGHLNYSGADKVTSWLGNYLSSNYEFDDYSNNGNWIKDYESYYDYKKNVICSQDKLVSYLVQLEDDDFTAEAYLYKEKLTQSERLNELFDNANIKPLFEGKSDDNICARLVIKSNVTGEIVEDVSFEASNNDNIDIFAISKIINQ